MTKYAYELQFKNGVIAYSIQNQKVKETEILNLFKDVVKVKFHKEIPNGYHLCGCGNLAKGNKDELCEECMKTYGHKYEHEL